METVNNNQKGIWKLRYKAVKPDWGKMTDPQGKITDPRGKMINPQEKITDPQEKIIDLNKKTMNPFINDVNYRQISFNHLEIKKNDR